MDELKNYVEGAGENEGEEETETSKIDISLRAESGEISQQRWREDSDSLEFPRVQIRFRSHIRNPAFSGFRQISFCSNTEHALKCICEQDRDEATVRRWNEMGER